MSLVDGNCFHRFRSTTELDPGRMSHRGSRCPCQISRSTNQSWSRGANDANLSVPLALGATPEVLVAACVADALEAIGVGTRPCLATRGGNGGETRVHRGRSLVIRIRKLARDRGMGEGGGRGGGRGGGGAPFACSHGMDDLPDCVSTPPRRPHVMGFFCDQM